MYRRFQVTHLLCFSIFIFFVLIPLSSCSRTFSEPEPKVQRSTENVQIVELFLGRASVQSAEFEQLKLQEYILEDAENVGRSPKKHTLFAECGKMRHGRHHPISQGFEQVTSAKVEPIHNEALKVIALLQQEKYSFDPPGDGSAFFDPGKFLLKVRTAQNVYDVKTSLDSIAEPTSKAERALKELAIRLKSLAGESLCSNSDFYGLTRQS